MPSVDVNKKRGTDAQVDLERFWSESTSISATQDILTPLGWNQADKWGNTPDRNTDIIIPLGKSEDGYVSFDFTYGHHLLAGGNMLSGVGMFRRVTLLSLLRDYSPESVRVLLLDPIDALSDFDDIPHLLFPRASSVEASLRLLEWCQEETDRRCAFLEGKERTVVTYNKHRDADAPAIPHIIIFISELGEFVSSLAPEGPQSLLPITLMARATGIHFVITTQRPGADTVPAIVRDNFLNRIAFQMPYEAESQLFVGESGAEALLGQGDMLFRTHSGTTYHLQGLHHPVETTKKTAHRIAEETSPKKGIVD